MDLLAWYQILRNSIHSLPISLSLCTVFNAFYHVQKTKLNLASVFFEAVKALHKQKLTLKVFGIMQNDLSGGNVHLLFEIQINRVCPFGISGDSLWTKIRYRATLRTSEVVLKSNLELTRSTLIVDNLIILIEQIKYF